MIKISKMFFDGVLSHGLYREGPKTGKKSENFLTRNLMTGKVC